MSNMICFNCNSDSNDMNEDLNMSNGGTSVFVNVLCLSGGRHSQRLNRQNHRWNQPDLPVIVLKFEA